MTNNLLRVINLITKKITRKLLVLNNIIFKDIFGTSCLTIISFTNMFGQNLKYMFKICLQKLLLKFLQWHTLLYRVASDP